MNWNRVADKLMEEAETLRENASAFEDSADRREVRVRAGILESFARALLRGQTNSSEPQSPAYKPPSAVTSIAAWVGVIILVGCLLTPVSIWLSGDRAGQAAFTCGFKLFFGVRGPECDIR